MRITNTYSLCICAVWSAPLLFAVLTVDRLSKLSRLANPALWLSLGCVCVYVWGEGGRGVISYIWHFTDVRAEWPPFPALPGIWLAPFFQQKVYEWPDFSGFLSERPHFSGILVYAYIFCSEIFQGCLLSWYSINWLWYLSNYQQLKGTKNQMAVYE